MGKAGSELGRNRKLDAPVDFSSIEDERFGLVFQMANEMPIGLLGQRQDRRITGSNQFLRTLLGYAGPEDLHARPVEEVIAPEHRASFLAHALDLEQGMRRAYATVLQRRDGTTLPVLGIPQCFSRDGWEEIVGFHFFVELATVYTAKADDRPAEGHAAALERVSLELRALSLAISTSSGSVVPLEHPELRDLSDREREVLIQLVDGKRVATMAKRLHISPSTVRNHLKSIYRKLDVGSQSALLERVEVLSRQASTGKGGSS